MRSIRCGRGLGDSIYLQSVVRHLVRTTDKRMRVYSDWPDVFMPLGDAVEVQPFTRTGVTITAHYVMRKAIEGTTQFEDCCRAAQIAGPVEMRLDWREARGSLIDRVLSPGKPVVCVALPRSPMGRLDGFGAEVLPDCAAIQRVIDALRGRFTIVQIGAGKALYEFRGIDIDLANQTTVAELIDLVSVSSGVLGYCSFILPLAESLDKPALMVWSRRGLHSGTPFIAQVTPRKLLHKRTSMWIMDDAQDQRVEDTTDEFCRLAAGR